MTNAALAASMTRRAELSERMATPADWRPSLGRHAAIPCDRTDAWDAYRKYATQASVPAGHVCQDPAYGPCPRPECGQPWR